MRNFDVYSSESGAYIYTYGEDNAKKLTGITGHVTEGVITDKFNNQIYNIYLTKSIDENHREYYALKDGDNEAKKITGLPRDARLLAIHNSAGLIYFGSSNGAYALTQGKFKANKVARTSGPIGRIIVGHSARPIDVQFLPELEVHSNEEDY